VLETVKEFECPYGGKVGDLIDISATETMHFHMTEERHCETWYGGRTVLLGDGKYLEEDPAVSHDFVGDLYDAT
jgi:hypothetical protein